MGEAGAETSLSLVVLVESVRSTTVELAGAVNRERPVVVRARREVRAATSQEPRGRTLWADQAQVGLPPATQLPTSLRGSVFCISTNQCPRAQAGPSTTPRTLLSGSWLITFRPSSRSTRRSDRRCAYRVRG